MSNSDRTLSGSQMTPGGKAFEVDFAAWSKEEKAFQVSEGKEARQECPRPGKSYPLPRPQQPPFPVFEARYINREVRAIHHFHFCASC